MTTSDIVVHRLYNQLLTRSTLNRAQDVVAWMGAMQAQEYAMCKWAIGLRSIGLNDRKVEDAFNNGDLLRTHLLRPTWHFVAPADIRWMLALTAPGVNAFNSSMYRKMELDDAVFDKAGKVVAKVLKGEQFQTRSQLQHVLAKSAIVAEGVRLSCLMMKLELDALICSGPRLGKQFTYALLEERVPAAKPMTNEQALTELATRYFASRGPATAHDFSWWSGLSIGRARHATELLPADFVCEVIDKKKYFFRPVSSAVSLRKTTFLMPEYDEYGIAYKDRSAIAAQRAQPEFGVPIPGKRMYRIVIHGLISGTWYRGSNDGTVVATHFPGGNKQTVAAVARAVKGYEQFFSTEPI